MKAFAIFELLLALGLLGAAIVLPFYGDLTNALLCGIWSELISLGILIRRLFDKKWPFK